MIIDKIIILEVSDEAINWFVENGYSEEYGARPISKLVDNKIKDPLVDKVLFGNLKNGGTAKIAVKDNEIIVK